LNKSINKKFFENYLFENYIQIFDKGRKFYLGDYRKESTRKGVAKFTYKGSL